MKDPILVVLAAGMGSRYGGLKQIDPIGPNGEIILELSAFDAIRAGFKKIVFIIKHEIEKDFKEAIGNKLSKYCEVEYVFQDITKLPEGCVIPEGRVKPWGTAHAIMCCNGIVDAPFAVINADDYYGVSAFKTLYNFLTTSTNEDEYAMVGYRLGNTVSEYGSVARGVCSYEDGKLTNVRELTKIEVHGDVIEHTVDGGETWEELPADSLLKQEIVNEAIENVKNINIKQYLKLDKILEYIVKAISAVTSVVDIFIAVVVSIYVLAQRTRIITFFKRFAAAVFKENTYKNMDKYFNDSNEIFFKFLASQFLDAVIVGILVSIAMSIMGIKYAPLLGFFIGLFNMIPYVGAIIAVGISAIITLITGGLSQAIWMLIVVIIIQQIDANIITPRIIGQSLKISPLLVMFAIMIGRAYFGILGMFLAVPVIAVIKILLEDYINVRLAEKKKEKQNSIQ